MKYSYKWIKELSGTDKTVDEITQLLLTHSFEIESIEHLDAGLEDVVIGHVLSKEKHPDANRLNVAMVDVKTAQLQIVCGAPNLEVGQKVPVAVVGAKLPCGVTIAKSKIRGIESNGMICAEDELGIGKNHEGIIVLDADASVGESFAQFCNRDDAVIDIKILPNRGHDCLSHRGIANEIMALEGNNIISEKVQLPMIEEKIDISIETDKCRRYIGVKIDHVSVQQSPKWLTARLIAADIKPINVLVDITNYVMLETGQPLHAFDAKRTSRITVRQARESETLTLLDDTQIPLDARDIVITDGEIPIALAGVMGGKDSSIADTTTEIILESASFDAPSVRHTQRQFNMHTDAAFRFERDIDPNLAAAAARRAIELYQELCNGHVVAISDIYPFPVVPWTIMVTTESVTRLLGIDIPRDEIVRILSCLGMSVEIGTQEELVVTVPTIRRDVRMSEDVIEEIGRVYGYEKISKKPLTEDIVTPVYNELRACERELTDLCVASGFSEVKGYSFYSGDDARAIGMIDETHVSVLNPLTPELTVMRRSLLPELCHFCKKNLSYFNTVQIFDIGRIYNPSEKILPDEKLVLGAAVASRAINGEQFYVLKGMIELVCNRMNVGDYYFDDVFDTNVVHIPDLHPSRRALIRTIDGVILGWIGETTRKQQKYFGVKKNRVAVCELYIEKILTQIERENFFVPLAKYPYIIRDISMIVEDRTRVDDVERSIYASCDSLIKDVDLFDLFDNAETGETSMAFHIVFGSDDRTLTSQEADEMLQKITTKLIDELNVTFK